MARLFDADSDQYLLSLTTPLTGPPFAISVWYRLDIKSANNALFSINSGGWQHCAYLRNFYGTLSFTIIQYAGHDVKVTTAHSANVWNHGCALGIAPDNWQVLLNGSNKGTDTTTKVLTIIDRITIGRRADASGYMDGRIAEPAIWDLSAWPGATAADKAAEFERVALPALAQGFAPSFFTLGLKAYWPLHTDEDQDEIGGYHMTPYNSPTTALHPPQMIYPISSLFAAPAAAPPVGWHRHMAMTGVAVQLG